MASLSPMPSRAQEPPRDAEMACSASTVVAPPRYIQGASALLSQTVGSEKSCGVTALVMAAVVMISVIYSLPLLLAGVLQHKLLYAETRDDTFYEARVLQLVRGKSLGNPYLVEHEDAPRYMPEMVEQALALAIRATHANPLKFVASTRALFPALIFLFVYKLARELDLDQATALLAGTSITMAPSPAVGGYALRYFRVISPAAHVSLLMVALWLLVRAWREPSWRSICPAGIALGMLLYTPLYYWGFALSGAALLALLDSQARRPMVISGLIAVVLGAPSLLHSARVAAEPVVHETLVRMKLMIPGRSPEIGVLPRVAIAVVLLAITLWFRRSGFRWARFSMPFVVAGIVMLLQNLVTNRQIQAYHMTNCLVPLGGLALAGCFQAVRVARPAAYALAVLLLAGAFGVQVSAYSAWLRNVSNDPGQYAVDTSFTDTIAWLNRETLAESVLVLPERLDASVPLFTPGRTYYSPYVFQYVVADGEIQLRQVTQAAWVPGSRLPYHADYVVRQEPQCRHWPKDGLVFGSITEGTCIYRVQP